MRGGFLSGMATGIAVGAAGLLALSLAVPPEPALAPIDGAAIPVEAPAPSPAPETAQRPALPQSDARPRVDTAPGTLETARAAFRARAGIAVAPRRVSLPPGIALAPSAEGAPPRRAPLAVGRSVNAGSVGLMPRDGGEVLTVPSALQRSAPEGLVAPRRARADPSAPAPLPAARVTGSAAIEWPPAGQAHPVASQPAPFAARADAPTGPAVRRAAAPGLLPVPARAVAPAEAAAPLAPAAANERLSSDARSPASVLAAPQNGGAAPRRPVPPRPAWQRHAAGFEAGSAPPLAVVLIDDGLDPTARARMAQLEVAVTFALPRDHPDLAAATARYRASGHEVLALAAEFGEAKAALAAMPGAVGVLLAGQGSDVAALAAELQRSGFGLAITEPVEGAMALTAVLAPPDDASGATPHQQLNRSARHAVDGGAAGIIGRATPEMLNTLETWLRDWRARWVALAPVTALWR